MAPGGGVFHIWLGRKGRVLTSEASAFMKGTPGSFLTSPTMRVHGENMAIYESGSEFSSDSTSTSVFSVLILDFPASRNKKN